MYTTTLFFCLECKTERDGKICERCDRWNVTCTHLTCTTCGTQE